MPKLNFGEENGRIINSGQAHLACAVLVDTSSSMASASNEVAQGLNALRDALEDDPQAQGKVELCVISFNDVADVVTPFHSAIEFTPPTDLSYGGTTAMHAAVDLAMGELDARKAQYRNAGTTYYRPWIFLLTDGGANDADNGAFDRLLEYQRGKHGIFFPLAIGPSADRSLLASMQEDNLVLTATKSSFAGAFKWLSDSLTSTSRSKPGDDVELPITEEHQFSVIRLKSC